MAGFQLSINGRFWVSTEAPSPEFLQQHLPRNTTAKDEHNAAETTRDPECVAVYPSVEAVNWAETVRQDPTTDPGAARRAITATLRANGRLMLL